MSRIDNFLSSALAMAALLVSSGYVYSVVTRSEAVAVADRSQPMKLWERAVATGRMVAGDSTSPATMLVFSDFQCPACRGFHSNVLSKAIAKYPDDLRVIYLQFPLSYHVHALPAARAGECVSTVASYGKWVDLLFRKQDSLGVKSFGSFAQELGITDTMRITRCAADTSTVLALDGSISLGKSIALTGTPTVVFNGWVLAKPPTIEAIDSMVTAARKLKLQ